MVNIGTLFAFVVVCAAVLILRIQRPDAHRPFRCPAVFVSVAAVHQGPSGGGPVIAIVDHSRS